MLEKFGNEMENRENEPFVLDSQLLADYPEMQKISGLPTKDAPKDIWQVSQVYVNGRTIDSYISNVKAGESTGNIEYHLQMVEDGLNQLDSLNKIEYEKFINEERKKLEQRKKEAQEVIGDKKRDTDKGGRYL